MKTRLHQLTCGTVVTSVVADVDWFEGGTGDDSTAMADASIEMPDVSKGDNIDDEGVDGVGIGTGIGLHTMRAKNAKKPTHSYYPIQMCTKQRQDEETHQSPKQI